MNMNDTETMKGILVSKGHEIVEDETIADAVIVNTCAVRQKAEDKFFGKLGRLKHLKNTRAGVSPENEAKDSVGAEHRSALKKERKQKKGIMVLCPYVRPAWALSIE